MNGSNKSIQLNFIIDAPHVPSYRSQSANLDDANGNLMGTIVPTASNEDESLSLSEYTDNEKSAPTELLAEFLTSIMKKDYVNALKYCKLSTCCMITNR